MGIEERVGLRARTVEKTGDDVKLIVRALKGEVARHHHLLCEKPVRLQLQFALEVIGRGGVHMTGEGMLARLQAVFIIAKLRFDDICRPGTAQCQLEPAIEFVVEPDGLGVKGGIQIDRGMFEVVVRQPACGGLNMRGIQGVWRDGHGGRKGKKLTERDRSTGCGQCPFKQQLHFKINSYFI